MKGVLKRERMKIEVAMAGAWHGANLSRADPKRFPSLGTFLSKLRPQAPTPPAELLAGFRRFAKAGLAVKIGSLDREDET
jgi:hypothetical protein